MKEWIKDKLAYIPIIPILIILYIWFALTHPQPPDPLDYTDDGPPGASNRFGQ